jgi:hypothetical protein
MLKGRKVVEKEALNIWTSQVPRLEDSMLSK